MLLVLILIIQIPRVQTYAVSKITDFLYEKTQHKVDVQYVNISWFDEAYVEKVRVYDFADSIMLSAESISVNFDLVSILTTRELSIDRIEVSEGLFHIIKHNNDSPLNLNEFIYQLSSLRKKSSKEVKEGVFEIEEFDVWNSEFRLDDMRYNRRDSGYFDYKHIHLTNINTTVNDLKLKGDTIRFHVSSLATQEEKNQIRIDRMSTNLELNPNQMIFSDLKVETGRSVIEDYVKFEFNHISNLSYFIDSVKFDISLQESKIHTSEVALFAPSLKPYREEITVGGHFYGSVPNMQGEYVILKTGMNTLVKGNCFITGLPRIQETFMDVKVGDSRIDFNDLNSFFPVDSIYSLKDIGTLKFEGNFLGFVTDFVSTAEFKTDIGQLKTDINLKLADDRKNSSYSGTLSVNDIDLGRIVGADDIIDNISMAGKIEGKGLSLETADFDLDAEISEVKINNYVYTNLKSKGHFKSSFFNGKLEISDPNLKFSMDGTIDLRKGNERIEAKATLDTLFSNPLNLSSQNVFYRSDFDVALYGLSLDDITGKLTIKDSHLAYNNKVLDISSLDITSFTRDENRLFKVTSDGVDIEVDGNFTTTQLVQDVSRLYNEYKLQLINDRQELTSYYANAPISTNSYKADLKISIDEANKFINPFLQDIYVSDGLEVTGAFLHDENNSFTLVSQIDSIVYKGNAFKDVLFEFNSSKLQGEGNILALFYLYSANQAWASNRESDNLELEAIWSNDEMDLSVGIIQSESDNKADLRSRILFLEDTTSIILESCDINFENRKWQVSDANHVLITNGNAIMDQFVLSSDIERISINGQFGDSSDLKVDIDSLNLDYFSTLIGLATQGNVSGQFKIRGDLKDPLVLGNLKMSNLVVDKFEVGNIQASTNWNDYEKMLSLNLDVERGGAKNIEVEGDITFQGNSRAINLKSDFNELDISFVELFLSNYLSDVKGTLNGYIAINGDVADPIFDGELDIQDGGTSIDYLKTQYEFSGKVDITSDDFRLDNFEILDKDDNKAYFSGVIKHENLLIDDLDIDGDIFNFNVLNTSVQDNSLYYGQVYATGNVKFVGSLRNIKIIADAKTNKNTKLFVPLTSTGTADLKDYISFVNLSDTTLVDATSDVSLSEVDLRGVELDLELEATPDAYFELIFDLKAGDIIRGRGNGNIKMQINTEGDFKMSGDYLIEEGGYNFTLYNIINKEFIIAKNSKISWYGDPYKAVLDINATYQQNVSLEPIIEVSEEELNSPGLKRRFPSMVTLDLTGQMLSPDLGFDINFSDYEHNITLNSGRNIAVPDYVEPFKYKLQNDEDELKRQVFSLLILRKLSPPDNFSTSGGSFGNSVSELISNQLSYWINQVDENLEIDVDLSSLDQDAFNTFQLRLSYTFLNGRLRVSRQGGFASYDANTSQLSSIIGDISVEYLLTSDGRLRAKMYSSAQEDAENPGYETGVSLQYVRSFDYLQDVWKKNRGKKTKFVDADGNVVEIIGDKKKDKKKS